MLGRILILLTFVLVVAAEEESEYGRWGRGHWTREALAEKMYRGNLRGLQSILSVPQMPERYLTGKEKFAAKLKVGDRLRAFTWSNCGSDNDPVKINVLSIQPDPIKIPGDLTVGVDVSVAKNVSSPLPVDMDIQKKVAFWWVTVPCVDEFGSCNYADFCPLLPSACPPSFLRYNIPCNCPVQEGKYTMPSGAVTVPELPLPSWLTSGDYKVKINAKDHEGNRLMCINLQLSLA